jgi:glyoxylase I family protein
VTGVVAFSHVAVRVGDLDRALALYRDRLGFRPQSLLVVEDAPSFREAGRDDAKLVAWFGTRDGTVIELQAVTTTSGRAIPPQLNRLGFRHLAFRVDDVEAAAERVVAAGGTIDRATFTRTQNADVDGVAVFGADPDGQRLEFLCLAGGPGQPCGTPLRHRGDVGDGTVSRFAHVAVGVRDLDGAASFATSALSGVVEHRSAARAVIRVFETRIALEAANAADPRLGIRHLRFLGPDAVELRDPDGTTLVIGPDVPR